VTVDANLNLPQREAVLHGEGPLMVLAGAGSGKTRVLTQRIATLVDRGVPPSRILAVTFTNKAAGEMRERLHRLLHDRGQGMWIGTFHSICARLLRVHAPAVGLTRDFAIFDDDDQKKLVTSILKEQNVSERVTPRAVLSRIDRARNAGNDPANLPARDLIDDIVRRVFPVYTARLLKENAVDFNDLLLKVVDLCRHPQVGPDLGTRFRHVLVDEFQDTNLVQYWLVRHFSKEHGNLCVVGDDDQSIYAWRGAEPRNLLDFDRDFPIARVVKLEQNYRSTHVILSAANAVISKNRDRHDKALWTERKGGEPILVEECMDERAEADFITQGILGLRSAENRTDGDFAVLYRTHAQSRALEEALRARRIRYRIVGGISFFQRREIKDITEYLRLITNPQADTAFERVVNVPTRGIGDTTVDKLRAYARTAGIPMLEGARNAVAGAPVGLGAAAQRKLQGFVELIDGLRTLVAAGPAIATLVSEVIERSEYKARLEIEDAMDGPDRARNLGELVAAAAAFDAEVGETASLTAFLERISLTATTDDKDGRGECVTLMTIHAAKGLEFPVVFLAGLEEGVFPALREGDDDQELEEERRLAYVALTRAKDRAIITYARTRRSYDQIRRNEPSRFLNDLPPDTVAVRARRPAVSRPAMGTRPAARALHHGDHAEPAPQAPDEPVYYLDDEGEDDPVYPRGTLVRHRIFGVGEIKDGSGRGPDRKLNILFPGHGLKTIVARFVERVQRA
jgi:DNA helicase-2/ATP-dependent DNA helicase PcrA